MKKIAIISSSVRDGRISHRAALYLHNYLHSNNLADSEILDLKEYGFPLFSERLSKQKTPSAGLLDFTERFTAADGIFIVTPVYNGSFPASIKNIIDVYNDEWHHKPVAVMSVTYGFTPGIATVQAIQSILLKMGALVVPALATVINTVAELSEEGTAANPEKFETVTAAAIRELMWMMERSAQR